jgi:BlaI family transcriptional regulator, penicillinase repressor
MNPSSDISSNAPKPTDAELSVLHVLWQHGAATVRFVNDTLNSGLPPADVGYTTTLKIMQIMAEKKLLTRDESTRTHVYSAAVAKEAVQTTLVNRFVANVFRGSALSLALQALGSSTASNASTEELQQLRTLLDEHLEHRTKSSAEADANNAKNVKSAKSTDNKNKARK